MMPGTLVFASVDSASPHPINPPVAVFLGNGRDGKVYGWSSMPGQAGAWSRVPWENLSFREVALRAEVITIDGFHGWVLPAIFLGFDLCTGGHERVVMEMEAGEWEGFPGVEAAVQRFVATGYPGRVVRHGSAPGTAG